MSSAQPTPPAEDGMVGSRYALVELIGRGGLGEVWRARDVLLDRDVAVKKVLTPMEMAGSGGSVLRHRLEREARAAARLNHPNVAAVFDVLTEDGQPWIVMEYVPGTSLQRLLEEGPIPVWQAAQIGTQVLRALTAAHARGILHRDVKPSNIRIDPAGRAVLTDFGIAQMAGDASLTATGYVVGSPAYIPPERVQGERATPASDLWALGATLYAAVEGRSPYERSDAMATLAATLTEPVPLPRDAGALTPVLMGLLAREPDERMTAAEAERRLEEIAAARPGQETTPAQIDGYRLERLIGGSVWLAADERTGGRVAVRLLPAAPSDEADHTVRAARALRDAEPEGVVRVLEIGEPPDGDRYVVTEYADAGSLAWRLAAGPIPPAEGLRLLAETARRVAAVNRLGVRYGTLEATKVLFQTADDGERVLLGLPTALPPAAPDPDETRGDRPPEADAQDDLHALGVLARRLVTDHMPQPAVEAIDKARRRQWPDPVAFAEALEAVLEEDAADPLLSTGGRSLPSGDLPPEATAPPFPAPDRNATPSPYEPEGHHTLPEPYPTSEPPESQGRYGQQGPYARPGPPGRQEPHTLPIPGYGLQPGAQQAPWGSSPTAPPPHPDDVTEVYRLPAPATPRPLGRWGRLRWPWRRGPAEPPPPAAQLPWTTAEETAGVGEVRSSALYYPLHEPFRYVHEPLSVNDAAIPLLGNERLIRGLKERLANSQGGTFLVTGFRGVGKTTLVERALKEIAAEHPRGRRVLPVVLSVARPMSTSKLLFAIVRRVFEELTEAGVLDDLPAQTRQSLLLAYMRTSLSFKETRSDTLERTGNVDLDPGKVLRPLAGMIPKAGLSSKRSRSLATEAAFLAYSETDVEHDMMRIVRMLSTPADRRGGRWPPWRRRRPLDLQLVVVLDEVDKLTALRDGLEEVERLLSGIKNVVTMRGAHYLVVAGPDLHDQVLRDSGRGNGIYESIFAWRVYVPCSWAAPARLLEGVFLHPPEDRARDVVEEFGQYLRFKSRGVLRRLLHELNSFVVWEDADKPYLRIGSRQYDAVSFYALLERSLDDFFVATAREVLPTPIDQDRWRLSAYYVMDWILRSEGRPFTSADVMQAVEDQEFDPLLQVSQTGVDMLLAHLASQRVLDVVRGQGRPTDTLIADVAEAQRSSYKLADELLARLLGIAVHHEGERAELDHGRAPLAAVVSGGGVPIRTLANRYELRRLIGEGGTSSVYEGRDLLLQRPVAVKLLRTALRDDPLARRRFLREARIAEGMHHPNVVDVYEVVTIEDEERRGPADRDYAIVMELIAAPTLREVVERRGALPAREVARLGIVLARALCYLWEKGLARIDLKPHNIVMSPQRGPVIIDLGIAKIVRNEQAWLVDAAADGPEESSTQTGIMIGTPAYLAPEQMSGERVDIRADIYALGLVLYIGLAGRHPYEGLDLVALMARTTAADLDTSELPCSPELRRVVARAAARDPAGRFQQPEDLLAALRGTPEGRDPRM